MSLAKTFKINEDVTIKIDFDIEKYVWIESYVFKDLEYSVEQDNNEHLLELAEACLLVLVEKQYNEEFVFAERFFNISNKDSMMKEGISFQSTEEDEEGTYGIMFSKMNKKRFLELYKFFKEGALLDVESLITNNIKKD